MKRMGFFQKELQDELRAQIQEQQEETEQPPNNQLEKEPHDQNDSQIPK